MHISLRKQTTVIERLVNRITNDFEGGCQGRNGAIYVHILVISF